jgi:hypothetical protein
VKSEMQVKECLKTGYTTNETFTIIAEKQWFTLLIMRLACMILILIDH